MNCAFFFKSPVKMDGWPVEATATTVLFFSFWYDTKNYYFLSARFCDETTVSFQLQNVIFVW